MNGKEEFESSKMVAYCKDSNGNIFVEIGDNWVFAKGKLHEMKSQLKIQ